MYPGQIPVIAEEKCFLTLTSGVIIPKLYFFVLILWVNKLARTFLARLNS
jgi:hypothetical protein